jgi:hypothetical protein
MEGIMHRCEVCNAKEGASVRLPAGDTVPRQLFRCPNCNTVICNGCMRQEYVVARSSRNPLKIFAEVISGAAPTGYTETHCTICNTVMDLYANRIEAEVV